MSWGLASPHWQAMAAAVLLKGCKCSVSYDKHEHHIQTWKTLNHDHGKWHWVPSLVLRLYVLLGITGATKVSAMVKLLNPPHPAPGA